MWKVILYFEKVFGAIIKMLLRDGVVDAAIWLPSPNFDNRPKGIAIDLMVIHNISLPAGQFEGTYVEQLFTNCLDCDGHADFINLRDLRVSSHFLIKRDGELIQFVNCGYRAWHAGISEFEGRENCNDFSLGVELQGTDCSGFTDIQYFRLTQLTKLLMSGYPKLSVEKIVGHSDIAPTRKTDPGKTFDWERFRDDLVDGGSLEAQSQYSTV